MSERTDKQARAIVTELRAVADLVCACERRSRNGGPHAFVCPTRQIGKRLDRLAVLLLPRTRPTAPGGAA